MKRDKSSFGTRSVAVALLALAAAFGLVSAGDLEPPGAPAPTMKTLEEAEPRIPIFESDLPLTINASGSYYLAEHVDLSAAITSNGIIIGDGVAGVTIDLMGFTLRGGNGVGITVVNGMAGRATDVTVRNGVVAGWSGDGIDLTFADGAYLEGVIVSDNAGYGIQGDEKMTIRESIVRNNTLAGIWIQDDGLVEDCVVTENGQYGVVINGPRVVVRRSVVSHNGISSVGGGIVSPSASGTDCYIEGNHVVENNNSAINTTLAGCVVTRNSVRAYSGGGIGIALGGAADRGPIGQAATATSAWANFDL